MAMNLAVFSFKLKSVTAKISDPRCNHMQRDAFLNFRGKYSKMQLQRFKST